MDELLTLTADIVGAHVANNNIAASDIPELIRTTYDALKGLREPQAVEAPKQEPAVSIRASVKPDYIVCLDDGKKLKMLKRYIASRYNMTPAEYRAKWGLPADYPMVAPGYSATRKELALNMGLGRKPAAAPATAPAKPRAAKAAASPSRARRSVSRQRWTRAANFCGPSLNPRHNGIGDRLSRSRRPGRSTKCLPSTRSSSSARPLRSETPHDSDAWG